MYKFKSPSDLVKKRYEYLSKIKSKQCSILTNLQPSIVFIVFFCNKSDAKIQNYVSGSLQEVQSQQAKTIAISASMSQMVEEKQQATHLPSPLHPSLFFTFSLSLYLHATFCIHVTQGCRARRGNSRAIFILMNLKTYQKVLSFQYVSRFIIFGVTRLKNG